MGLLYKFGKALERSFFYGVGFGYKEDREAKVTQRCSYLFECWVSHPIRSLHRAKEESTTYARVGDMVVDHWVIQTKTRCFHNHI